MLKPRGGGFNLRPAPLKKFVKHIPGGRGRGRGSGRGRGRGRRVGCFQLRTPPRNDQKKITLFPPFKRENIFRLEDFFLMELKREHSHGARTAQQSIGTNIFRQAPQESATDTSQIIACLSLTPF